MPHCVAGSLSSKAACSLRHFSNLLLESEERENKTNEMDGMRGG